MSATPELRYTVELEFDGLISRIDQVPESVARDWLWEHVAGGTVQSSLLRIREVTPLIFNPGVSGIVALDGKHRYEYPERP